MHPSAARAFAAPSTSARSCAPRRRRQRALCCRSGRVGSVVDVPVTTRPSLRSSICHPAFPVIVEFYAPGLEPQLGSLVGVLRRAARAGDQ